MKWKNLGAMLAFVVVLLAGSAVSFAQTSPISGMVELTQADGKKVPVAGALIELYRVDINAGKPLTAKTDKRGGYVFAGVLLGGQYAIAVSAPNASPDLRGGLKAGLEKIDFLLSPGDGKKFTPEEVIQNLKSAKTTTATAGQAPPAESAESKKAKAEYEAKVKEVTEKNKKAEESNKVVFESLKVGNDAFNAKNYDAAITAYTTGINADPTHPGAPVLLANRSQALRSRGVNKFNAAVVMKGDDAGKAAGMENAKADFSAALESSTRALQVIKDTPAPTDPTALKNYEGAKLSALFNRSEDYRLVSTRVDSSKSTEGLAAYQEYIAAEPDPMKKNKSQLAAAQMLLDSGNLEAAVPEYKKVLEVEPGNVDALVGLGLSLVSVGYSTNDKTKFQDGVNYLQKFVDVAPPDHKYRADAVATIESIKNEQKIAPQKGAVTTTTKKPTKGKN